MEYNRPRGKAISQRGTNPDSERQGPAMIVVRYVFQAKFGRGDEMVQAYKAAMTQLTEQLPAVRRARLLTDLSGPFFTVINELELDSLATWESYRQEVFSNPAFQQMMAATVNAVESGRTEFYTLEA